MVVLAPEIGRYAEPTRAAFADKIESLVDLIAEHLPVADQAACRRAAISIFSMMTKHRNRKAALSLLKRLIKKYGRPVFIVTDKLRSYRAAMKMLGIEDLQDCEGRWIVTGRSEPPSVLELLALVYVVNLRTPSRFF